MRRFLPREAMSPILGRLLLSLVLVVGAILMAATDRILGALGLLIAAFLVVGGAKRAR
jgi:hypothetical protein